MIRVTRCNGEIDVYDYERKDGKITAYPAYKVVDGILYVTIYTVRGSKNCATVYKVWEQVEEIDNEH